MCSENVQKIEKIIQKWWNGLNFGVWNGLISGVSSLHVGLHVCICSKIFVCFEGVLIRLIQSNEHRSGKPKSKTSKKLMTLCQKRIINEMYII